MTLVPQQFGTSYGMVPQQFGTAYGHDQYVSNGYGMGGGQLFQKGVKVKPDQPTINKYGMTKGQLKKFGDAMKYRTGFSIVLKKSLGEKNFNQLQRFGQVLSRGGVIQAGTAEEMARVNAHPGRKQYRLTIPGTRMKAFSKLMGANNIYAARYLTGTWSPKSTYRRTAKNKQGQIIGVPGQITPRGKRTLAVQAGANPQLWRSPHSPLFKLLDKEHLIKLATSPFASWNYYGNKQQAKVILNSVGASPMTGMNWIKLYYPAGMNRGPRVIKTRKELEYMASKIIEWQLSGYKPGFAPPLKQAVRAKAATKPTKPVKVKAQQTRRSPRFKKEKKGVPTDMDMGFGYGGRGQEGGMMSLLAPLIGTVAGPLIKKATSWLGLGHEGGSIYSHGEGGYFAPGDPKFEGLGFQGAGDSEFENAIMEY